MSYQTNFTDPVTGANITLVRIRNFRICKAQKWAGGQVDLFAGANTRVPARSLNVSFQNTVANPTQYSSLFAAGVATVATPLTPAVNADDIMLQQAYLGLKTHPLTEAMLTSATVV